MKVSAHKKFARQLGMTLMEVIASLAIMSVVVVGALSLYGGASASQAATAMTQDVSAIRSALKTLWAGQGTYGTSGANLNAVLKNAGRIPSTMTVSAATPPVITHSQNGTLIAAAGATTGQFTLTLTNIPTSICTALASGASSWLALGAGVDGTTPITLPATPVTASTGCSAVTSNIMIFTGS